MRARTTAAAFLGALALVLPASGQAMADDDYDGHHTLGRLYYVVEDEDGDEYTRHISPSDNDTCYELTGTSRHQPATEAYNRTESLAVLFEGRGCNGRAVRTLAPGGGAHDVEALSVYFRPTGGDGHGHHDGGWNDDEDRRVRRDARPEQGRQTNLVKPAVAAVAAPAAAPAPRPADDEPSFDESADEQSREDEQRGEDEQRDEAGRPGDDQAEDENGQRDEARDERGQADEDEARDERGQNEEDEARDEDGQRDERGQDGDEEEEYGVLDTVFRAIG
ncbi:hypothetical protein ACFWHQ_00430 [Streptomyces sp. NPDC060334]|uniref:hypothetical protein n=1 Tax=unclassified Streptomyces TaxID=2593676 RepID=UPI0006AFB26C|nr:MULTISPECIES: hypothetical protein [unclassified Streptomyces]KOU58615.1 hypothetical protein ADK55_11170 [Streptomyces sp. WM4235]MCX5155182.1 hypothetical protein [Streptomyces sp. NBC_00291]